MPSTYSSRLRLELMASGEQSGSWGTKTNTNLGTLIEEAIAGYTTKALSDANYTLSTANGATDEARQMMLKFTGTLTANRNITVPTASKLYFVENATTGGFSLTFKTASGTGVEVLSGEKAVLYCDGTNVLDAITRRPGYNAIINGDMNIWQRGTSFAAITDGAFYADRWRYVTNSTAVHTVSRSTDVPTVAEAGRLFNYSTLVDCTTADGTVGAGEVTYIAQKIEGFNWLPLAQRAITISFWVKATKTGIYCVSLRNSGVDRSYVGEYTVNTTATWEFKTVTIAASPSAGTWNYTNGTGVDVAFALLCGSTSQTTAGAWQTGNFLATANQVNACDSTANDFRITGVKLEPGSVATMSLPQTYDKELMSCQRYYNTKTIVMSTTFSSYYGGSNAVAPFYDYPVPMRTSPSLSITNAGIEYYSFAGVWTASTLVNWSTSVSGVQVSCASDGDGRSKLVRSGSGGVDPSPILVLSAEL